MRWKWLRITTALFLTTSLLASMFSGIVVSSPDPIFEIDFETGDFSQCTSNSTSGGTTEVISVSPHHGTYHSHFSRDGSAGGETAKASKDFASQTVFSFRLYVEFKTALPSDGGHYFNLISFTVSGVATISYVQVYTVSGSTVWRVMYKNGTTSEYMSSSETISLNTRYSVEFYHKIDGTNGEVSLYINDVEVCGATNQDTDNYGNIDRAEFGIVSSSGEAKAYGNYIDCIVGDISHIGEEDNWWYKIGETHQIAGYSSTLYCYWETTPWSFNMSGSILSTNNTGQWSNSSWVNLNSQNTAWHNQSLTVNSTEGITISYRFYGNNTEGNWQTTSIQSFMTLAPYPPQWSNLMVNNHKNGTDAKFSVKWNDPYFDLHHSILCTNVTGADVNYTTTLSGNEDWHNISLSLPATPLTAVHFKFYGNNTQGKMNVTSEYVFLVYDSSMALHAEGKYLIDDAGNNVILKGICKHGFEDFPNGTWPLVGQGGGSGYNVWNETNIKLHLDAMKVWGFNTIEPFFPIEWWLCEPGWYERFKDLTEWALEREMYMIVITAKVNHTSGHPLPLPYPPWNTNPNDTAIIGSKQEFMDFWINVTLEMRQYPNVLLHISGEHALNETEKADYLPCMGSIINGNATWDGIRDYADHIVGVQSGIGMDEGGPVTFEWVEEYHEQYGYNVEYGISLYNEELGEEYSAEYETLKTQYEYEKVKYVLDTLKRPIYIAEMGCNMANNLTLEYPWYDNTLHIFDEWNVHWNRWWWWLSGVYRIFPVDPETWIERPLAETGFMTIAHLNPNPFVWTASNETGMPYCNWGDYTYHDNVDYTEDWLDASSTLEVNLTGSGDATLRVYWETWNMQTMAKYPVNSTLRFKFSNQSIFDALDFYNGTTRLIEVPVHLSQETVLFGYNLEAGSENHWQFTFDPRDRDNNIVTSQVTQKLYNQTQELTYTQGEYTLLDGTYTLKTYYKTHQINETTLPTSTYGNTTVTINLEMKEQDWGYLAFNGTLTSLTINEQTNTKIKYTAEGPLNYTVIIDVTEKPAYVSKDGVNQTEGVIWTYSSGLVVIQSPPSVWELGYPIDPASPLSVYTQILISALTSVLTVSLIVGLFTAILTKLAPPTDPKLSKELDRYAAILIGLCLLSAMLCTLGLLAYI